MNVSTIDLGIMARALSTIEDGTPLTVPAVIAAFHANIAKLHPLDLDPALVELGEAILIVAIRTRGGR